MKRTAIESSLLSTAAYDAASQVLELSFRAHPEKVYHYSNFTPADWEAFQQAESKGSHFLKTIKPKFPCRKIEEEHAEEDKEARKPFKTDKDETTPF